MATRNVVLTEPQTRFVEQLVRSGRYQNASEVLREGLRLIQQRERNYAMRAEVLKDAVATGVADIKAGRHASFDDPAALEAWVMDLE